MNPTEPLKMEADKKDPAAQPDLFQVMPVESPSENYLVIENLREMPNIFSRGLIYIIVLAVISAFFYAVLAKIDVVVDAHAVVRPATHVIKILFR